MLCRSNFNGNSRIPGIPDGRYPLDPNGNPLGPDGKPLDPVGFPTGPDGRPYPPGGIPGGPDGSPYPIGIDGRPLGPDGKPLPIGPNGRPIGPDGYPVGPNGQRLGPDGNPIGPDGRPIGPDGRPVGNVIPGFTYGPGKPGYTNYGPNSTYPTDGRGQGLIIDPITGQPIEIDECELMGHMMCKNGRCINTMGSFKCECNVGFRYDDPSHMCVGKYKPYYSTKRFSFKV